MHFGDPTHIKASQLQIVVYKHDTGEVEMLQVYSCKYMNIIDLLAFNSNFLKNFFHKQLDMLNTETFYIVELKCDDSPAGFTWIKHTEITDEMIANDPLLTLH